MGCKYCERNIYIDPIFGFREYQNKEIIECGIWSDIALGVDEKGKFVIIANSDGPTYYYPKYCPECGSAVNK